MLLSIRGGGKVRIEGTVSTAPACRGRQPSGRAIGRNRSGIDGIIVAPSARSSGTGSRLLHEALLIAREEGLRWLRLDVIDTNPRARQLYERLGYRVTRVQSFRHLRRLTGFGAIVSMQLDATAVTGAAARGQDRG
jgi:ribosomal protein S18 acetylase RimI-like enzyme